MPIAWSSFALMFAGTSAYAAEERCLEYAAGILVGHLGPNKLEEASGLAVSDRQAGVFWSHNDSGDEAWIFAMDGTGQELKRVRVDGAEAVDWEDIALGRCAGAADVRGCLFIADTGNNDGDRDDQAIYRVAEPNTSDDRKRTEPADTMGVTFVDGDDVEAIFIADDAGERDVIWLVAKHDDDARLFRIGPFASGANVVAVQVAQRSDIGFITAADANTDGSRIVMRTRDLAWEMYRDASESVVDAFLGPLVRVALEAEEQGEALALAADDSGFFTTSEGPHAPIFWYRCSTHDNTEPVVEQAIVEASDVAEASVEHTPELAEVVEASDIAEAADATSPGLPEAIDAASGTSDSGCGSGAGAMGPVFALLGLALRSGPSMRRRSSSHPHERSKTLRACKRRR